MNLVNLTKKFQHILYELKEHIPFTMFGAFTGIGIMTIFKDLPYNISYNIFYVLHPLHIVFSAFATSAMYHLHKKKLSLWKWFLISYIGSVGTCTISDSVIPYLSEVLLNMPHREIHLGFVEEWWLVNSVAVISIAISYFIKMTKIPHFLHVLVSTWASLFHIIMASGITLNFVTYITIFIFLFITVWIPCCLSDIVFPLLFVNPDEKV